VECEICSSAYTEHNLRLCGSCMETIMRLWKITREAAKSAMPVSVGFNANLLPINNRLGCVSREEHLLLRPTRLSHDKLAIQQNIAGQHIRVLDAITHGRHCGLSDLPARLVDGGQRYRQKARVTQVVDPNDSQILGNVAP
jgi:hypothetical protein